jgi:lysophospholipase L1-like esterase
MSRPALRSVLVQLLLVSVSISLTAALLEGILRLAWDDYYLRAPRGNVEFHPVRGWTNTPGVRVEFGKPEYRVMLAHNSLGFRGPEISAAKPRGRVRILALGDSMTYGLGAENDETFSAVLEQLDPTLEVINGGVPAYSPAEELLLLKEWGPALSLDIVLVGFLWNDLRGVYRDGYARFTLEGGELQLQVPPDGSPEHPILKKKRVRHPRLSRSYLYRFVSDRIKILRYSLERAFGVPGADSPFLQDEEVEPAWNLVFALLREMERVAAKQGAQLIVMVIPDQVEVEPDIPIVGLDPMVYTVQERLLTFGRAEGIPVIDLLPGLRAAHEREGTPFYFRFDRHLNPAGHRAIAEILLDALQGAGYREAALRNAAP